MGVRIPRLKQIQSSDGLPPNQRININVPNQAAEILRTGEALRGVAKEAVGLQQDIEDDKINQLSSEVEQEYKNWSTSELNKLRTVEGDPTEGYVKYEEESQLKYNEILESKQGNSRVKGFVKNNLDQVRESQRVAVNKQRGLQNETYESNLYKSTLKLKKDELATNAAYIVEGDKGSFLFYDKNIADIKTTVAQRGLKNGTVSETRKNTGDTKYTYIDGNGEKTTVYMGEIAQARAAKELNDGVVSSINSVISSGEIKIAKTMMKEYEGYLDPKGKTSLQNKIATKDRKSEAYDIVSDIRAKDKVDQEVAVDKIKDPEVKSEVLKIMSADASRRASWRKNKEDNNYEALSKGIVAMKKEGKLHGMSDLEDTALYGDTWNNLSAKDQKSITEEFNAPKKSDPKAVVKMQEAMILGIDELSPLEFQRLTVGLSKSDKNKYNTRYLNAKAGKSNLSQTMRINKRGAELLKSRLFEAGLIDRDFGKLDDASVLLVAESNDALIDYLATAPSNLSDKELNDHVKNFVAKAKKTSLFGEGFFTKKLPISTIGTAVPKKRAGDPFKGMDKEKADNIRFKLQRKFKEEFNRALPPAPTDPAFLDYVQKNIGSIK